MNLFLFRALAMNEVRLRLRRTSTMVALLGVVILSWLMISDPASGSVVLSVKDAPVVYTSSVIAIGAASLATILFGAGGFYLVRGRMSEDIRSGTGSVIGATPVGSVVFLLSRWVGGMAYLGILLGGFTLTLFVLHLVRGHGPLQLLVYLQTIGLLLVPMLVFAVSFAVLFDSYAPLMGKAGDVLYFFLWCGQLSAAITLTEIVSGPVPSVAMFDISGVGTCMLLIRQTFATSEISLGMATFAAAAAPLTMKTVAWSGQLVAYRGVAALLALLPLMPAFFLFHRFSPDRVKVSTASVRRSPLQVLNALARPLAPMVRPLFRLAAATPGVPGQVMADVALTLAASPAALLALVAGTLASAVLPLDLMSGVLAATVAFWGILISDLSTRDIAAETDGMTGAVPGGALRRYPRQLAATFVLGMMFTGVAALRFAFEAPLRALALVVGVMCLTALATFLGRVSRSGRLFLALFLFYLFMAINGAQLPMNDIAGFNGVANMASISVYLTVALAAIGAGWLYNRRMS